MTEPDIIDEGLSRRTNILQVQPNSQVERGDRMLAPEQPAVSHEASCESPKSPKVGCWKKGKVAKQLVQRWIQFDDGKLLQWSDDAQDSAAKKTMISKVATVEILYIADFPHSPSQVCKVRFANKEKTQKRGVFMEEKDVQAWAGILRKQALVKTLAPV
ncbi:hypothetical protein CYMTET_11727 [Cymbomonas tetramitiformis]|uniref:PH domain-containing protein n=1 Tax=Cymbomonas tetramitiformis TaxID=36881 RepID=A0AAE0LD64_9CHLO|nr:hypothetical protein CYMTET_11727 [Cymbomonas tetramitiformis]